MGNHGRRMGPVVAECGAGFIFSTKNALPLRMGVQSSSSAVLGVDVSRPAHKKGPGCITTAGAYTTILTILIKI